MQPQSHPQHTPITALSIEAWIHPISALTPSLIVHNLELLGMQLPQLLTIAIDRGHYDCTGANYAVISVRTQAPIAFTDPPHPQSSFNCSFFSQKAVQGMEPNAWYPHWIGNCYVHMGEPAAPCSCRHESGHAKTWRKPQAQECDREDAVSVDPLPPANPSPRRATNANAKPKSKDLQIIQLQKKNLVLRTELDVLRCELHALKTEVGGLVQQHKEQEAATKRANQCMQDWTNKQVIERVWILEKQHAQLRSEHLKQKEQQQQQQQQKEQQQKEQCEKVKLSKKSKKELKKLSKRLELLENMNNNNRTDYECNKCNDETISCNPFDFKAIYEPYDQHDACPALDLIANHYADVVPSSSSSYSVPSEPVPSVPVPSVIESLNDADECTDDDDDDDDDLFQLIQIEVVSDFSLPK
jgi:hypothetical protein